MASSASEAPDGGGAVLASAAEATREAGSSQVAFTLTTELPAEVAQDPVTFTGEGEFDYTSRSGRVAYDFSDLLATFGQTSSEPVEMRFLDNVFYMKFPLLSAFLPGAKEWIEFDLESLGEDAGIDLSQLQQLGQSDPSQALDYLRATGQVEEVGTEEVDGVETTHYTGTIRLDAVAEQVPADQRDAVREAIEKLKKQSGLDRDPGRRLGRRRRSRAQDEHDVHRQGAGRAGRRRTRPRPSRWSSPTTGSRSTCSRRPPTR